MFITPFKLRRFGESAPSMGPNSLQQQLLYTCGRNATEYGGWWCTGWVRLHYSCKTLIIKWRMHKVKHCGSLPVLATPGSQGLMGEPLITFSKNSAKICQTNKAAQSLFQLLPCLTRGHHSQQLHMFYLADFSTGCPSWCNPKGIRVSSWNQPGIFGLLGESVNHSTVEPQTSTAVWAC